MLGSLQYHILIVRLCKPNRSLVFFPKLECISLVVFLTECHNVLGM